MFLNTGYSLVPITHLPVIREVDLATYLHIYVTDLVLRPDDRPTHHRREYEGREVAPGISALHELKPTVIHEENDDSSAYHNHHFTSRFLYKLTPVPLSQTITFLPFSSMILNLFDFHLK